MLLQNRVNLEELLVGLLAKNPGLSAKKIHAAVVAKGHDYSLRGVYKELGKLEDEAIIYKTRKGYSLQLTWIINLLSFSDSTYDTYTSPEYLTELVVATPGKASHRFTDIRRLDSYWIQLMTILNQLYPKEPLYLWCPYQWFSLVHSYTSRQFYRASELAGAKRYHIIGSDCFLARKALDDLPKNGEYSFSQSPFSNEMSTYYTLIGEYVITVKLDEMTTKRIATLFEAVKSDSDLSQHKLSAVFNPPIRGSLAIVKNPKKEKQLKRKFTDFFGVKLFT